MKPMKIYKSGIHLGEEKIVEGNQSSGMITFTGCHLACNFCYTPETSVHNIGTDYTADAFTRLVEELVMRGARNLNLISPTHFWPSLSRPLMKLKLNYGRLLPLVLKISGYEGPETIHGMASLGDVIVPDFKVYSGESAGKVNLPQTYGKTAQRSIELFIKTHGFSHYNDSGKLTHGLLVRHLMMPGFLEDSLDVVRALAEIKYTGYLNLMTYYIDPRARQVTNANPDEVLLLSTAAEQAGMKIMVNGKLKHSPLAFSQGATVHAR